MGEVVSLRGDSFERGNSIPRLHTKLNDLPSKGGDIVDFAAQVKKPLLPWQEFVAIHAHKLNEKNRWANPLVGLVVARQNGKSTFMAMRILTGLFVWDEPVQIASAHRLGTAVEVFRKIVDIVEANDFLISKVKKIGWTHGQEEIQLMNGCRYVIRAANNAARGIAAPESIHMDETREYRDEEGFASMRYTTMASKNPQIWAYSNAGSATSVVLNKLRERALGAIAGADDNIGWFEWSAKPGAAIDDPEAWCQANPSLGYTIDVDNIKATLNDPPAIVRTEVLCQWVETMNAAIPSQEWVDCGGHDIDLDPEKITWLGIDVSPDRRSAALVAAQKTGDDTFIVKLLETWFNTVSLDDKKIANEIAPWVRRYPVETVLYSKRTAANIAAKLSPAGIPVTDLDGVVYHQACDELLSAVTSKRLQHSNQEELTKQVLSAAKLQVGDGAWIIGRRASNTTVTAAVATALVTHKATRPDDGIDIVVV